MIAAELTQLGFEVMALFDLTVGEMRRRLAQFEEKVSAADWVLVSTPATAWSSTAATG